VSYQVNACAEWYYNASIQGSTSIVERLEKLMGDNATLYWPDDVNLHKAGSFQFAMSRYHMRETPYDDVKVSQAGRDWAWKNVRNSVSWTVAARRQGFAAAELWGAKLLAGWLKDPESAILRYRDTAQTYGMREDNDLLTLCMHRRAEQETMSELTNTTWNASKADDYDKACTDASLAHLGFIVSSEVPATEPPPKVNETVIPLSPSVLNAAVQGRAEAVQLRRCNAVEEGDQVQCGQQQRSSIAVDSAPLSAAAAADMKQDENTGVKWNTLQREGDSMAVQAKNFAAASVLKRSPPAPVKIRRMAPKHQDASIRDNQDLKISFDDSGAWLSVAPA